MLGKIVVVGAGVVGLTSAIEFLQKGFQVTVFTDQDPLKTTSTVAGAIWMPYKVEPEDKMLEWARSSLEIFNRLKDIPAAGVMWCNHTELFNEHVEKPGWMKLLPEGEAPKFLVPDTAVCMYSVKMPIIDTPKYMKYLLDQFIGLGGKLEMRKVSDLRELTDYQIILNCSGVWSGELAHDDKVYSVKGQAVSVTRPSTEEITESMLYINGGVITLVIPHADRIVIGVTAIENDLSPDYDVAEERAVLGRAVTFFPSLAEATVIERKVGFRPVRRDGVRLELEPLDSGRCIVHNYGHAGGGVTLAPGCAIDVVTRVVAYLKDFKPTVTPVKEGGAAPVSHSYEMTGARL